MPREHAIAVFPFTRFHPVKYSFSQDRYLIHSQDENLEGCKSWASEALMPMVFSDSSDRSFSPARTLYLQSHRRYTCQSRHSHTDGYSWQDTQHSYIIPAAR